MNLQITGPERPGGWKIICGPGLLLVVSHDRYFLDRVVGRIAPLERGELKCYRGNYSAYVAQRQLERASMEKVYQKQLAAVKRSRFLYGRLLLMREPNARLTAGKKRLSK